ncbi:hypothetical protein ACTCUF_08155 [Lactococcus lactis]
MSKCPNCNRDFDDEVIKGWGSNLCEDCCEKLFGNEGSGDEWT